MDELVSAEIPSCEQRALSDPVLKYNLHQPYGELSSISVCNEEGDCSKRFPKDFLEETGLEESEFYATYRHCYPSDGGETALWRFHAPDGSEILDTVNNSWVVPYCPALSNMSQCHLNVELCNSRISGIKYPFKYIYKRCNRMAVTMMGGQRRYDEISRFEEVALSRHLRLYEDLFNSVSLKDILPLSNRI